MNQEVAIALHNVSKCFKQYSHPVERLREIFLPVPTKAVEFWALRNIDLEVIKGETLGLIGRNGSGKSTLLQIIAGTLTATQGEVETNGRISALLELGSGFNPEFTGRQNVFFNGRLLGLLQQEIEDKFDDIEAFADIGTFMDQPVKTYSSGMFIRLAFAVAINADPDILIVDEALAVGDEAFQRKCFARIKSFQERGKTILFVSHSAGSVVELCNWAILVDQGEILVSGTPKSVVAKYHKLLYAPPEQLQSLREELRSTTQRLTVEQTNAHHSPENINRIKDLAHKRAEAFYDPNLKPKSTIYYLSRGAEITDPYITTLDGKRVNNLVRGEEYIYQYSVTFTQEACRVRFGMLIKTTSGFELGGAASHSLSTGIDQIEEGTVINVEFKFTCSLFPSVYFLNNGVLGVIDEEEVYLHRCVDALMFRVQPETDLLGTSLVDFQVESNLSELKKSSKLSA